VYLVKDFYCYECDLRFDSLVKRDVTNSACPTCSVSCESVISAPRLGKYNDPTARAAELKQRSHNHTMKELKKQPEKYGFTGADRSPWNVRSSKSEDKK